MATDRYFIGPNLLGDIRRAIRIVGSEPERSSGPSAAVRLQSMTPPSRGGGALFRICTFTGTWAKNSSKTLTFKYQTTTPNTVSAMNVFDTVGGGCGSMNAAIARDGTAWFLIQAECE